jgi:predicted DCC family thiol-disulfide oxidoreductase YuxK
MGQTTMYYDGGCPLCRREVIHYRRLDHAGRVRWVDISREPAELEARGVTLAQGMARLHGLDREGRLVSGAWAFAAVWRELPGYRWLGRTLGALGLLGPLDAAYRTFARWRFRRRCQEGACAVE